MEMTIYITICFRISSIKRHVFVKSTRQGATLDRVLPPFFFICRVLVQKWTSGWQIFENRGSISWRLVDSNVLRIGHENMNRTYQRKITNESVQSKKGLIIIRGLTTQKSSYLLVRWEALVFFVLWVLCRQLNKFLYLACTSIQLPANWCLTPRHQHYSM
jgi:hypothetical protein